MLTGKVLEKHTEKLFRASQLLAMLNQRREQMTDQKANGKPDTYNRITFGLGYRNPTVEIGKDQPEWAVLTTIAISVVDRQIAECEELIKSVSEAIHTGKPIENL
jgi:hypothetical protein